MRFRQQPLVMENPPSTIVPGFAPDLLAAQRVVQTNSRRLRRFSEYHIRGVAVNAISRDLGLVEGAGVGAESSVEEFLLTRFLSRRDRRAEMQAELFQSPGRKHRPPGHRSLRTCYEHVQVIKCATNRRPVWRRNRRAGTVRLVAVFVVVGEDFVFVQFR